MDELDKELGDAGMHIDGDDELDEEGMPKKIPDEEDGDETDDDDEAAM